MTIAAMTAMPTATSLALGSRLRCVSVDMERCPPCGRRQPSTLENTLAAVTHSGGLRLEKSSIGMTVDTPNITLFDGGVGGDADTSADNSPFAKQGVFIP